MSSADAYERYMLTLVNAERALVGAPALSLELNLNAAADAHSVWILEVDIFSHTGEDDSSPTDRIRAADFDLSGSWGTAENIAVQSERGDSDIWDDIDDLHASLMNSEGHRENILNPDLEYIGIGIAVGDFDFDTGTYESVIATQSFAFTGGTVDLDSEDTDEDAVQDNAADTFEFIAAETTEIDTTDTSVESVGVDILAVLNDGDDTADADQSLAIFGPSASEMISSNDFVALAAAQYADLYGNLIEETGLQLDDLGL